MTILQSAKKINRKGDLYIQKYGEKNFHQYASELLKDADLHELFDYQKIVQSAFLGPSSQKQNYRQLEFSDLPVTLSRGENCFIDVYFWRRRPTTIHNHHFTGAFMCLTGNNVDLKFSFKRTKKIGKYHDLGVLKLEESRMVKPGDVIPIPFLDRFIHQNHHQADLTVNLCFRTPESGQKNLSNYLYSGLRYEKNSSHLGRLERLRRFIDLGEVDTRSLSFTDDDILGFLLRHEGTHSENPRLKKVLEDFHKVMKKNHRLNVRELLKAHDDQLDQIESEYE
jgi:hypothetical protein